ncbi:MAG: glycosyltransferase [Candidatus Levybacteria bacterium]|nr:glycosyltransferase [Candidatus Levybacteria bacterium]
MKTDNSNSPQISVVIPVLNEEKFIHDCIASVIRQDVPFPFETIIVDNGCTDNTIAIAKKFPVRIVTEAQKGLSFARQAGLDAAKAPILVNIDADTRLTDHWLEKVHEYFAKHPDVAGISCDFKFYDGTMVENIILYSRYLIIPPVTVFLRLIGRPDILLGQSFALRTESLRKAGGIDLNLVFHGEDTMIGKRLSTQGKVRFLWNLGVKTSARRYKREGVLRTLFVYVTAFLMIQLGFRKKLREFVARYNP